MAAFSQHPHSSSQRLSDKTRDNNVRAWTAIRGLMAALGPVVGGLLVAISWRWVTGSAVSNMLRQVGLAIGVAILVAVLGTPTGAHDLLDAFDHSWLVIAAFAAASALASPAILGLRRSAPYSAPRARPSRSTDALRSPRKRSPLQQQKSPQGELQSCNAAP